MKAFTPFLGIVLVSGLTGSILSEVHLPRRGPLPTIDFDHARHRRWGLICEDCHRGARLGRAAGLPGQETCGYCHGESLTDTPPEKRIVALVEEKTPLLWLNPRFLPPHVIFSHRRHTKIGGLECADCHGPVGDSRTLPIDGPTAGWLDMDECIDCHQKHKASTDCSACHS